MLTIVTRVQAGQTVEQGQLTAEMVVQASSTPHFEIHPGGKAVNPIASPTKALVPGLRIEKVEPWLLILQVLEAAFADLLTGQLTTWQGERILLPLLYLILLYHL